MEINQLLGQLTESKKVENFSKEFFTLLGDLSSSFKQHLEKADAQTLKEQKLLGNSKDEAQRKEELSGKQELQVEVKLSDEKKVALEAKPPSPQEQEALALKNTELQKKMPPPQPQIPKTPKASKAAPISQKLPPPQTEKITNKIPQQVLEQDGQKPEVKKVQIPKPQVATQEAKQAINPEVKEKKITEQQIKSPTPPPSKTIKIAHNVSEKLQETLKHLAKNIAVQAPHLPSLSQHVISSLQAQNSPLIQNQDSLTPHTPLEASQVKSLIKNTPQETKKTTQSESNPGQQLDKMKEKIIKQVRMHLKLLIKEGQNEIQIKLKPAFLGNMKITIGMEEENTLTHIRFHVQNESTKELLQNHLHQLKDLLEEKQISLEQVDVSTEDQDQQASSGTSSYEDLKESKKWIQSFHTLKIEDPQKTQEAQDSHLEEEDPNQVINIVV